MAIRLTWEERPPGFFNAEVDHVMLQLCVLQAPKSGRWRGLLLNGDDDVIASCYKDTADEAKEALEGYAKARLEEALEQLAGKR